MEEAKLETVLNNNETGEAKKAEEPIVKPSKIEPVAVETVLNPDNSDAVPVETNPEHAETGIVLVEPIPKSNVSEEIQTEPIVATEEVTDNSVPKPDEPTVAISQPCDDSSVSHESNVVTTGPTPVKEDEVAPIELKEETHPIEEASVEAEGTSNQVEEITEEVVETDEERLEKLTKQRGEIRHEITKTCDEISSTLQRVGSLTSLNAMVIEAEDLLRQSEELNDQICEFYELVDTAKEFQLQLEYQRVVQDAKEDVQNYSDELF